MEFCHAEIHFGLLPSWFWVKWLKKCGRVGGEGHERAEQNNDNRLFRVPCLIRA